MLDFSLYLRIIDKKHIWWCRCACEAAIPSAPTHWEKAGRDMHGWWQVPRCDCMSRDNSWAQTMMHSVLVSGGDRTAVDLFLKKFIFSFCSKVTKEVRQETKWLSGPFILVSNTNMFTCKIMRMKTIKYYVSILCKHLKKKKKKLSSYNCWLITRLPGTIVIQAA